MFELFVDFDNVVGENADKGIVMVYWEIGNRLIRPNEGLVQEFVFATGAAEVSASEKDVYGEFDPAKAILG